MQSLQTYSNLLGVAFASIVYFAASVNLPDEFVTVDHVAHAKPGGPYFSIDWNGDSMDAITLDASQSHTHYFDHSDNPRGTIIMYEWFSLRTGKKLLQTSSPYLTANFFSGITLLKLVVTDDKGHIAHAYTYVSVRDPQLRERRPPAINSIYPKRGAISGGTLITIIGEAFYNNPMVYFAGKMYQPHIVNGKEMTIRTPAVKHSSSVPIHVSNGFGTSAQRMLFDYDARGETPVKFQSQLVRDGNGAVFRISEITCIRLGPDLKYYAGSQHGFIHVLGIDRSLTVRDMCSSPHVGAARSVLGIAFDPGELAQDAMGYPRVYATTSTLMWPTHDTGENWDNGRVEIWRRQHSEDCLSHERTVISGLPVSTGDHGVNALAFRDDGTLAVSVGGATNAGVSKQDGETAGIAESPLSAAVLSFPLQAPGFNGTITYTQYREPGTTRVRTGNVSVFANGLRNAFGMTTHSNGRLYALDNGPNEGFGRMASGCFDSATEVTLNDKLVDVRRGAYYGHANWNRARDDARQCAYVRGDAPDNGVQFAASMTLVQSSTNGIVEYSASVFGGQLQGDLVLSRLAWTGGGVVKSVKLDETGTRLIGRPLELHNDSGIAIEMGTSGELLMPQLKQGVILGLLPVEPHNSAFRIITVIPRRGPAGGGNVVTVTGDGLTKAVRVMFGGRECIEYEWVIEGKQVKCKVAAFRSGARQVDVIARRMDGTDSERSRKPQYSYMLV